MIRVLVFPCGSEVALEIYRSAKYSTHIELIGANSVNDHGKFVYDNYIDGVPFVDSDELIPHLKWIVEKYQIDAIYPAMDKVIEKLKCHEDELGCKVISSELKTTQICLSKSETYEFLKDIIKVPKVYKNLDEVDNYPVFLKPIIGYGSRGVYLAKDEEKAQSFFLQNPGSEKSIIITEYLPGEEFTVDCFTDKNNNLLFAAARSRNRIVNGISVNTSPVVENKQKFEKIASLINSKLSLRGAWFFQVKKDSNGELTLLEVASRLGGSSALYRNLGVNFALLSIFDAFEYDVEVFSNDLNIELDRSLSNRYKINYQYEEVYVDFDDCLIIRGKVNEELVAFLYNAINQRKRITLITKHSMDIYESLKKYRLGMLFDEIIHIPQSDYKHKFITNPRSIFIDDSFAERKCVKENSNIPVFSPDMVESLINY